MTPLRRARLVAGTLAVGLAAGLAGASPAAADPPRPTDYRSVVESVEPDLEGVEVEVVGGDAFLEVRVAEGHQVSVAGYGGEPYLRFGADGTVERNRNSPATYLNEDRLGAVEPPPAADSTAEPDWETVATGGTYAWHDHNIHWMGGGRPPNHQAGDLIDEWTVALDVDGTPTTVSGTLTWADPVNPLPWAALALVVPGAVALAYGLRRRRSRRDEDGADTADTAGPSPDGRLGSAAALAAGVLALVVGWGQYADAPAGSGVSPLLVVVPLVGVVAGGLGLALRGRAPAVAPAASLAAVAAVLGWAFLRLGVFTKPVLPTVLAPGLDRAGTATALGLAVTAGALVVLSGGLVPAPAPAAAAGDGDDPDV